MKEKLIVFFTVFLVSITYSNMAFSQNTYDYTIRKFGTEQGLSSGVCNHILMDKKGFLWIATNVGLSRYNGHVFENFSAADGLYLESAKELKCDANGTFYVRFDSGIVCYRGSYPEPFKKVSLPALNAATVFAPVAIDSIYYLNNATSKLVFYTNKKTTDISGVVAEDNASSMEIDKTGLLYVYNSTKNILYTVKNDKVATQLQLPRYLQQTPAKNLLYKPADGDIWLKKDAMLYRLSATGIGDSLPLAANNKRFLKSKSGNATYSAGEANIRLQNGRKDTFQLPGFSVTNGFTEDEQGNVWIATTDGLFLVTAVPAYLYNYGRELFYTRYFSSNSIAVMDSKNDASYFGISTYQASDGTLWKYTAGGVQFSKEGTGKWQILPGFEKGIISEIIEDKNGVIWTHNSNTLFSYKNGIIKSFSLAYNNDMISHIKADGSGNIYCSGNNLYVLVNDSLRVINIKSVGVHNTNSQPMLTDLSGALWYYYRGGVQQIKKDNAGRYFTCNQFYLSLDKNEFANCVFCFDDTGNLWAFLDGKLYIYLKRKDGSFSPVQRLSIPMPELANNVTMCSDGKGKIYLANQVYTFILNQQDILLKYSYQVWKRPKLYITGVTLYRHGQDWQNDVAATDDFGVPLNPQFSYQQNFIGFTFSAISYPGQLVQYRYKLSGMDTTWQPITAEEHIEYSNLPPGNYIFTLQVTGANDIWSDPVTYSFTINSPWFNSWWFYLFCVGIIASGIYFFIYRRLQNQKTKAEHNRLILEHQLTALRAQINPHFVQNIFSFLAQRIRFDSVQKILQNLDDISKYMRDILYRSDKNVDSLEAELDFIKEYLDVQRLLHENSFDYEMIISDDTDTYGIQLPTLLLQPIVENAIKYGVNHQQETGKIVLDITQDEAFAYCRISDTGNINAVTQKPKDYTSKGMDLTVKRLNILYDRFANKPAISQYLNAWGGLTVEIKIPVQ